MYSSESHVHLDSAVRIIPVDEHHLSTSCRHVDSSWQGIFQGSL